MFSPQASCTSPSVSRRSKARVSLLTYCLVTSHPSDPQSRMGLMKCMEALQKMEIIWPSAARALELLRGAKFIRGDPEFPLATATSDRQKRAAEHQLDDSFDRKHSSSSDHINYQHPTTRSHLPAQYVDNAYPNSGYIAPNPVPQTSNFQWQGETLSSFNGSLSTSVLPQLYSTGLVDDRSPTTYNNHRDNTHVEHPPQSQAHRYPQYWNDYSTFSQLDTSAYAEPAPITQQTAPVNTQIYIPEQYSVYSM